MPAAIPIALVGAAAIGAAATSSSASKAANAQVQSTQLATQTQQNMFNQASGYEQPFIQGGQQAYSTLNNLLGVNGNSQSIQDTLQNLPGYQFTLNQGLEATQNGYAARGLADSGGALRGAANYATGLANSGYQGYVTGLQNSTTTGANAANSLAGNAVQTGSNIGANQVGAGNAEAAASIATGNAISSGANNISQYYTLNSLLNNNPNNSTNSLYGNTYLNADGSTASGTF